jgi:hypothetical protein
MMTMMMMMMTMMTTELFSGLQWDSDSKTLQFDSRGGITFPTSSRDVAHDQGAGDASGGPDFLT